MECMDQDLLSGDPGSSLLDFSEEESELEMSGKREEAPISGWDLPWKDKRNGSVGA